MVTAPNADPFAPRDRMVAELGQLLSRIACQRAFMGAEPFGQLTQTERRLMSHQLDVMGEYARTLQRRIDIFRLLPVEA